RVKHGEARIRRAVRLWQRCPRCLACLEQLRIGRERRDLAADPVPALDARQGRLFALQHRLQDGIGDHDPRRGVAHRIGDLVYAQAPVHGHEYGAEAGGRAVEIHELEVVLRQYDDAVAGAQPHPRQSRGQPLHAREVGGMCDALGSEDEGDAVWVKARIALHDIEQREITQPHSGPPPPWRAALSPLFYPRVGSIARRCQWARGAQAAARKRFVAVVRGQFACAHAGSFFPSPERKYVMNCALTCAGGRRARDRSYQNAIQLRLPKMAVAARPGLQGLMEPSAMPRSNSDRTLRSSRLRPACKALAFFADTLTLTRRTTQTPNSVVAHSP